MAKKILKGDELMLFKDGQSIALATSHSLTLTGDAIDENTKDFGLFGSKEINKITWEVTAEHLYSEYDYDALFDLMIAKTKFNVVFGQANYDKNGLGGLSYWNNNTSKSYYSGVVFISSLTSNANTGENASFSMTLTGVGSLLKNTIDIDTNDTHMRTLLTYMYNHGYISDSSNMTKSELAAITNEQFYNMQNNIKQVTDCSWVEYCTGVTELHESQFENSTGIVDFYFPPNVTQLPRYLFRYSSSLQNIKLSNRLTVIRSACFRNCDLQNVTIPASVTSIQSYAFTGNGLLRTITFEGTTPPSFTMSGTPQPNPWDNTVGLTIIVPSGTRDAYINAFSGCFSGEMKFTVTSI